MMLNVDPYSPMFTLRIPRMSLQPSWQDELRNVGELLAFMTAWGLIRLGLWVSRKTEPVDVCPNCGPYPAIDLDGLCAECGRETFNTGDVRWFGNSTTKECK